MHNQAHNEQTPEITIEFLEEIIRISIQKVRQIRLFNAPATKQQVGNQGRSPASSKMKVEPVYESSRSPSLLKSLMITQIAKKASQMLFHANQLEMVENTLQSNGQEIVELRDVVEAGEKMQDSYNSGTNSNSHVEFPMTLLRGTFSSSNTNHDQGLCSVNSTKKLKRQSSVNIDESAVHSSKVRFTNSEIISQYNLDNQLPSLYIRPFVLNKHDIPFVPDENPAIACTDYVEYAESNEPLTGRMTKCYNAPISCYSRTSNCEFEFPSGNDFRGSKSSSLHLVDAASPNDLQQFPLFFENKSNYGHEQTSVLCSCCLSHNLLYHRNVQMKTLVSPLLHDISQTRSSITNPVANFENTPANLLSGVS